MVNINMLRGKLVEKGINVATAAEKIGLSRSALYRKLHRPHLITVYDAQQLKEVLGLTNDEASEIFFG